MYKTPTLWGYVLARKMWQNQNYLLRRKVLKMRRSEKGKKTDKILNCFVCVIVLSAKISWFSGFSSRPQSNFLELQKIFKHGVVILRLYKWCYFQIIAETDTLLPKSPPYPKLIEFWNYLATQENISISCCWPYAVAIAKKFIVPTSGENQCSNLGMQCTLLC